LTKLYKFIWLVSYHSSVVKVPRSSVGPVFAQLASVCQGQAIKLPMSSLLVVVVNTGSSSRRPCQAWSPCCQPVFNCYRSIFPQDLL